jgi:hypothetical protein
MSKNYLRAYSTEQVREAKPGEPLRFTASTEGIKRDGKDLRAEDWYLENFRKNPVFLWVHDYMGHRLPLGRVPRVSIEERRMDIDVIFDQQDEFALQVEDKYRRGFLNAVSVGWDDIEIEDRARLDLMDISGVPVGGDPDALMERQYRALRNLFEKDDEKRGAIAPHSTAKVPEDAAWDGPGEVAQAPAEAAPLRRMHSWVDDEGDPDTKRAYKLPHHKATGEVVWRGVAAAMSRLFQPATQIPDADRRGVYNHLRRHYQQYDKEPPEFRANEELGKLTPALIRGLFLEGEPDVVPWLFTDLQLTRQEHDALKQAIAILQDISDNIVPHEPGDEDDPPPDADGDEPDAELVAGLEKIKEQLDIIGAENE